MVGCLHAINGYGECTHPCLCVEQSVTRDNGDGHCASGLLCRDPRYLNAAHPMQYPCDPSSAHASITYPGFTDRSTGRALRACVPATAGGVAAQVTGLSVFYAHRGDTAASTTAHFTGNQVDISFRQGGDFAVAVAPSDISTTAAASPISAVNIRIPVEDPAVPTDAQLVPSLQHRYQEDYTSGKTGMPLHPIDCTLTAITAVSVRIAGADLLATRHCANGVYAGRGLRRWDRIVDGKQGYYSSLYSHERFKTLVDLTFNSLGADL